MSFFRVPALSILFCAALSSCLAGPAAAAKDGRIVYQSPVPGARYVTPETNICLRLDGQIGPAEVRGTTMFDVRGSVSGVHRGRVTLADDGQTLIFTPHAPFAYGEEVHVRVSPGVPPGSRRRAAAASFSFIIASSPVKSPPVRYFFAEAAEPGASPEQRALPRPFNGQTAGAISDTLPLDFPVVHTAVYDSALTGQIFISNFPFNPAIQNTPYLLIVDNSGSPVFYRKMRSECFDFKMQPNGLLTYYEGYSRRYFAMDSTYTITDEFACGNGYATDLHELRVLDNGHALLMSYDSQRVDMRAVVPGGDSLATVVGLIVQEIDRDKNVLFQWRSWDHFQITDATHENLLAPLIDYVHGNAIELDTDGNLMISSRHMDEITKINRTTGEIMWRLGGKNNQFTFINDSIGFSHQHAIRRLANGNIIFFDNGNYHTPQFSRAVEYHLDEDLKTAELVWQYRNQPDAYGAAMGYAQRLENGNTLIGWGSTNPSVTEVRPDGTKVFELTFDGGIFSYRAFRFPWKRDTTAGTHEAPATYTLSQNYPNPFNTLTNILVGIPFESVISFKIYDVQGRQIQSVVDGIKQNKGDFFVKFDGTSLASGIYFYRLIGEGFNQTRKMILMK